jgi:hypothetical protein
MTKLQGKLLETGEYKRGCTSWNNNNRYDNYIFYIQL